ncbi:uncharacterized protein METZ01_LOCUS172329, partial [marine metagenome]
MLGGAIKTIPILTVLLFSFVSVGYSTHDYNVDIDPAESGCDEADQDCSGECYGDDTIDDCGECSDPADFNSGQDDCGVCYGGNADDLGCGCFEPAALSYCEDIDGDGLGAGTPVDFCDVEADLLFHNESKKIIGTL